VADATRALNFKPAFGRLNKQRVVKIIPAEPVIKKKLCFIHLSNFMSLKSSEITIY
jgi:hypothetical protein